MLNSIFFVKKKNDAKVFFFAYFITLRRFFFFFCARRKRFHYKIDIRNSREYPAGYAMNVFWTARRTTVWITRKFVFFRISHTGTAIVCARQRNTIFLYLPENRTAKTVTFRNSYEFGDLLHAGLRIPFRNSVCRKIKRSV